MSIYYSDLTSKTVRAAEQSAAEKARGGGGRKRKHWLAKRNFSVWCNTEMFVVLLRISYNRNKDEPGLGQHGCKFYSLIVERKPLFVHVHVGVPKPHAIPDMR